MKEDTLGWRVMFWVFDHIMPWFLLAGLLLMSVAVGVAAVRGGWR